MAEKCPKCGIEAIKVSYHSSFDKGLNRERKRKEFHHGNGSHTVEIKE
jgi:hypothetical protein